MNRFGIRALCLKQSALKFKVSLPFFFFRIPRLQSTDNSWILDDLYLWIAPPFELPSSPILLQVRKEEFHTTSFRLQKLRNVQCPCENLFAYSLTFSELEIQNPPFRCSRPIDVAEHWHEDDPVCKFLKFNVPLVANYSESLEESAMMYNPVEILPLAFHWLSIDSQQFFERRETFWILPFDLPIL